MHKGGVKENMSVLLRDIPVSVIAEMCEQKDFSVYDVLGLAFAESSFRPDIVHPATEATGMYQLTPWAVERVGGKIAEMKKPIPATAAALDFLALIKNTDRPKLEAFKTTIVYSYLTEFERLAVIYHYGIRKAFELFNLERVADLPTETHIYISNMRRGREIVFWHLKKK